MGTKQANNLSMQGYIYSDTLIPVSRCSRFRGAFNTKLGPYKSVEVSGALINTGSLQVSSFQGCFRVIFSEGGGQKRDFWLQGGGGGGWYASFCEYMHNVYIWMFEMPRGRGHKIFQRGTLKNPYCIILYHSVSYCTIDIYPYRNVLNILNRVPTSVRGVLMERFHYTTQGYGWGWGCIEYLLGNSNHCRSELGNELG